MEASTMVIAPLPGRVPGEVAEEVAVAPTTPTPTPTPTPDETSALLARVMEGEDPTHTALRGGVGLALTLPFAAAVALRTDAAIADAALAALGLPVGLALVALVGVSASTLGISLVSAPLEPSGAASIASHGLFRAGLVLAGLAPLTALHVASQGGLEGLFVSTLVVFFAGVSGIGAIAGRLCRATADDRGDVRLGTLVVTVLFALFALVVGLRVWLPVVDVLLPSIFEGMD